MSCARCSANVERTLNKKVPGVAQASVNFGTETLSLDYDPSQTSLEAMAQAVKNAGYELILPAEGEAVTEDAEAQARAAELAAQRRFFWVGVAFTLPLFVISMSRDFGLLGAWSSAAWVNWLFFALATPVQFYTGGGFYVGGWKSIKGGAANMDVLVALGSSTAFFYSLAVLLDPRPGASRVLRDLGGDHHPDQAGQALGGQGQGRGLGGHPQAHGPGPQEGSRPGRRRQRNRDTGRFRCARARPWWSSPARPYPWTGWLSAGPRRWTSRP